MEPLFATILVLVVTDHNLVLAADSRKTNVDNYGVVKKGILNKINRTCDYYYASCGISSDEDGSFSLPAILHRTLLQYSDLDNAVNRVANILTIELKNYFTKLKESSLAIFRQFQKYSYSGGEIVIAKRVNSIPTAYLLDYQIIDGSVINVVLNTGKIGINEIRNTEECFWRAIGFASFLSDKMPNEKEMASDPIKKAKWIIDEGIRLYPAFVSEPIKILEMTERGEHWIETS